MRECSAQAAITLRPVAGDPVSATLSTPARHRAWPVVPSPVTTWSTFAAFSTELSLADGRAHGGDARIELRRFTFASSQADAQKVYDKLGLWTYDTEVGTPKRPEEMDADADCTQDTWRDNCAIYVYYEGIFQLERSGADPAIIDQYAEAGFTRCVTWLPSAGGDEVRRALDAAGSGAGTPRRARNAPAALPPADGPARGPRR